MEMSGLFVLNVIICIISILCSNEWVRWKYFNMREPTRRKVVILRLQQVLIAVMAIIICDVALTGIAFLSIGIYHALELFF